MRRRWLMAALLPLLVAACSSGPSKPQPAELVALSGGLQVRTLWSLRLGAIDAPLKPQVHGDALTVASADGTVLQLDAATGQERWRHAVGAPLAAGVGSDGRSTAVVTRGSELVVLEDGKPLWRQRLGAQVYTAPLVAGARVFILTADRAVSAYDGRSGARLWVQQRPGNDPLVLRQPGVLMAVGDTLVAGVAGRLVGFNPTNGSVRWDAAVATPRGINEIERLVDLVDPPARQGNDVCARAFQAAVACINTANGSTRWSRSADGLVGLAGDEGLLVGSEANGYVQAWRRRDGERLWVNERLRFRDLSAPLLMDRHVVVGDFQGQVHILSREDGSLLGRAATDGSAIVSAPVLAGRTLVVMTRAGGVFGLQAP